MSKPDLMVPAGQPPDARRLRDAALAHLARFAATEAGLVRVLDRRIGRWRRRALDEGAEAGEVAAQVAEAKQAARQVAADLVSTKVLDDQAYADGRVRSLSRGGRSKRAIEAHLAGRGVAAPVIGTALEQAVGSELEAAVLQTRKRRIGAFGPEGAMDDPAVRNRALGTLARAGFDRDTAERALDLDTDAAERLVLARHSR